jgi:PAS domain S-box-containing protein
MPEKSLLLADDDPYILKMLQTVFNPAEFRTICVGDGRAAVEAVREESIDVALLDMKMPKLNGLQALEQIKKMDPAVEVLILTGYADMENLREAIVKAGAFDYILKPFHVEEILNSVRNALMKREFHLHKERIDRSLQERLLHREKVFMERTRQLRESQIKYKQIVENSNDGIVVLQNNAFKFVNRMVMQVTGYTEADIMAMSPFDLVYHEERDTALERVHRRLAGMPVEQTIYFRLRRKNGELLWVEANDILTEWDAEPAVMLFVRDVSERKKAEEAIKRNQIELERRVESRTAELLLANEKLQREVEERTRAEAQIQKSKALLQAVFDGIADPLFMIDRTLAVRVLNKAAAEYFAVSYRDVIGRACFRALRGRPELCPGCRIVETLDQDQMAAFERQGVQDPARLEKVFVYPFRDGHDRHQETGAIVRIRDITEEKLLEKRLIQSEKLASLGLLVSGIAHEINNPNNFIVLNIPILREYLNEVLPIIDQYAGAHPDLEILGMPYAEFREDLFNLLRNMEHGGHRINATVSSLREFSRLRHDEEKRRVSLRTVIENASAICQGQLKKLVKSYELDIPDELPEVYTDPEALEQVLVNLLINAGQAADKKDAWVRMMVRCSNEAGGRIVIEVSDNGCGIDREIQRRMFEPFFTTKGAGYGTGLGLYVCQNLIEKLEGDLQVYSTPGMGSTFRISLAADAEEAAASKEIQQTPSH